MSEPNIVMTESRLQELLEEARISRSNYCKKNLHDLTIEGSRTKSGKCRLCWNAYVKSRYHAQKTESAGGNPQPHSLTDQSNTNTKGSQS